MALRLTLYPRVGDSVLDEDGNTILSSGGVFTVNPYYEALMLSGRLLLENPLASPGQPLQFPSYTAGPISVLAFAHGAPIGDGNTDATAAIQATLDYAANFGASVRIPSGRYRVTSTLTVSADVAIIGDGALCTVLDGGTDHTLRVIDIVSETDNDRHFGISDVGIDGGGEALYFRGTTPGVFILRSSYIHNVNITGCRRKGLSFVDCAPIGCSFKNINIVPGTADGSEVTYGLFMQGPYVGHYCNFHGLRVQNATGNAVHIEGTGAVGSGGSQQTIFHQLILEANPGNGIYLKSAHVVMYGGDFEGNASAGATTRWDIKMDDNYNGSAVDRSQCQIYGATFGGPSASQVSNGYNRIRFVGGYNDLSLYDIRSFNYPNRVDTFAKNQSRVFIFNSPGFKAFNAYGVPVIEHGVGRMGAGRVVISGSTAANIGISANGLYNGGTALALCSGEVAGTPITTRSGVYMLTYRYDDTNGTFAATHVAGTNFVTFSVSGSDVRAKATDNTNVAIAVFSNSSE